MRYRAGWLIEGQILALTHFDPVVTAEDVAQIIALATAAIGRAGQAFHMLIDNRIIADETVASLEMILQAFPLLQHPQLRWIVMVLPEAIKDKAHTLPAQRHGQIELRYVDSLAQAFVHLQAVGGSIDWEAQDRSFFVNTA
jgi:hypothetical protein